MDQPTSSYIAVPPAGSGPGILLIHPWWGLNETIKGIAGRLASEGYLVLAPDLYQGEVAHTIAEAESLRDALDFEESNRLLAGAVQELAAHPGRRGAGIAVMGLSLGGTIAITLAEQQPDLVEKVVVYYATYEKNLQKTRAAFQGHFAEQDEFEPREGVEALRRNLEALGRRVEFFEYPGTRHWFFEPDRPEYDPQAADLAWQRTLEFLRS